MPTQISENTPEEDAARTAQHARWLAEQQADDDRKQLAEQVRTALDLLDNGATLAQTRTILARLIRLLVRTGVIG